MKNSNLFAYCGFISAIITIFDCISKTIKNSSFTLSPIAITGLVLCVLFGIIHCIFKDIRTLYLLKKLFFYALPRQDTFSVTEKECIYTYLARTKMEFTKTHRIISKVNNLKNFCDKFKWSKDQKVGDINISSRIQGHIVTVRRVENWHQYNVEFDEIGKGQDQVISIKISNLIDENRESLPFLSSNIVCKTKKLKLSVVFEDASLKPRNIKYKVFDNYACDFPLFQTDVEYNELEHKIEVVEYKPIYGYRYEVVWDFEND